MAPRTLLALALGGALALVLAGSALAQGNPSPPAAAPPAGEISVPASLAYYAITVVAGAGGVLGTVIKILFVEIGKKDAEIATREKSRLDAEERRREEAERLLREQQAIMREALVATGASAAALQKFSEGFQDLQEKLDRVHSKISESKLQ